MEEMQKMPAAYSMLF